MTAEREQDRSRQNAVKALQHAVTEAIESGKPQPFDAEAFKQRMRERHGKN
ncbi:hypothetical protein [Pelagibacterium sp.]|uniref:hypothetical protein n=1 Tax=Pelagibacterium sp. TaxID=1967288 RepID=UPI003BABCEAD